MNTTTEKIQAMVQVNPFIQVLAHVYKGELVTELTEELGRVIAAVKRTGTKGSLTLKLSVKPDGKGEIRTVDFDGDVVAKAPKRTKRATTFFVVGEQSLSTQGTIDEQPEFDFDAKQAATPASVTKMPAPAVAAAGR